MAFKRMSQDVAPLSMRAAVRAGSVNAEKRTVDLVWTTGARVRRESWADGTFDEELSLDPKHVRLDRLNNGAPLLADHNSRTAAGILGVVESARIESGQGIATVRFASEGISPEADKVFALVRDGVVANISVGYRIHKMEKVGDSKIPVYRAVDWQPFELSVVAIGADDGAGFRGSEASTLNPCIFTEQNVNPEDVKRAEEEKAALVRAAELAEVTRAATDQAVKVERERNSGITSACRAAKLSTDFADKLIADKVEIGKAREMVLAEMAKRSDADPISNHAPEGSGIGRGEDADDKFAAGVSASIFARSGNGAVLEAARLAQGSDDRATRLKQLGFGSVATDPAGFRGLTLSDIARQCLERRGVRTHKLSRTEMIDAAIMQRNGEATVSDFSVLYENVMNKTLLAAYAIIPDSWRMFCKTDQVQDFRPSNRYRVGSFGVMPVVAEGAEFTNTSIPDGAKTAITTETKGQIIALSRQAIINDDMNANVDLAARIGRGFALTIEKEVYDLLALNSGLGPTQADTAAFFHANRSNVSTGAALSVVALEADRVKMAQQLDQSSNDYLGLRPSVLLIPIGLEGEANVLNRSLYDPTAGSAFERPNIVGSLFSKIVGTPRLSGTRRYLFADPGIAPAIVVAFLASSGESPFLEQRLGFRVDGLEWKARLDFKAQMFDPKGAVTNAGV